MKIKKVTDKKEEVEMSFNSKSLEKEKDSKPAFKSSVEDQEKIEKEFKKSLEKIHKFESFIDIHIDNIEKLEIDGEIKTENDDDDDDDEMFGWSEDGEGCGCCSDCSGLEDCDCGCEDCKCGESDENVKSATEFVNAILSEGLKYHLDNNKPVTENIFRPGSKAFYNVIKEARQVFDSGNVQLCEIDRKLFESTDIGKFAYFNGELVPLDLPMENIFELNEAEYQGKEVKLNYPTRSSGPKKYKVYVKNPKTGKVKVVHFGDVKGGLSAKVSDPKARKAFASRHQCHLKKDKTKPGYWACRLNRYGHLFGGKTYPGYW